MNDPASGQRESVLIILDDPGVARLERLHLQRAGFVVAVAATAEQALERIRQRPFDLFVLDQNLPGGVGARPGRATVLNGSGRR